MSALSIFSFEGARVRMLEQDGEPWFIASDVCAVLGIANHRDAVSRLDDDEKGVGTTDTLGGAQSVAIISEPGVYGLTWTSRKPEAAAFRRWLKHDVVPSIRRTGTYSAPALTEDEIVHQALAITARRVQALESHVAELTPRAEAWDELASAEGDYSVADAAKMLARRGIAIGPQRLFDRLRDIRWIFRGSDGKWRAYADYVKAGYLAERPQSHHHPRTGAVVVDAPQIRVTIRGLERLRVRLGELTEMEAV